MENMENSKIEGENTNINICMETVDSQENEVEKLDILKSPPPLEAEGVRQVKFPVEFVPLTNCPAGHWKFKRLL